MVKFRDKQKSLETENKWKEMLIKNLGQKQGQFRFEDYKKADIPSAIEDQIDWLSKAGFTQPTVIWEYLNYANYSALK